MAGTKPVETRRVCPEITGQDADGKPITCGAVHMSTICSICPEHMMAAAAKFWATMGTTVPDTSPEPQSPQPPAPKRKRNRNRKRKQ